MFKNLLVHLDASPRAAVRLALAQQLASRCDARLSVLYGVQPPLIAASLASGEGLAAAGALLADLERTQRDRACATFEQASHRGPLHWLDGGTTPYWTLLQHAPYQDLIVVGQSDATDGLTGPLPAGLVADVICDTGRPTLVVPHVGGGFKAIAERVLLAWKPGREATRAVHAALPLLRLARSIDVASDSTQHDDGSLDHSAELECWLKSQGVAADLRRHRLGDAHIGEALVSLAADVGAELLVMGCYGHSRTRERVLGGASRTVLGTMTLPVLMVH